MILQGFGGREMQMMIFLNFCLISMGLKKRHRCLQLLDMDQPSKYHEFPYIAQYPNNMEGP